MKTQAEEIAAMKVEITYLKDGMREINEKLDDLLALKYKGQGIFWLASALFGTSIIGGLALILSWFHVGPK